MTHPTDAQLVQQAIEARTHAYAPYSRFTVGAALLTKDGKVYCGANIENAAFGPTNCAERTAFFTAVYAGEREFEAIAVTGGKAGEPQDDAPLCGPCGVCRQVMAEFCAPDFRILLARGDGSWEETTLGALLPLSFTPSALS